MIRSSLPQADIFLDRKEIEKVNERRMVMEREKILFTSESVTEGHPDKMCDQISDAILDELMKQDPMSRVACETCCTTGVVMVMGEITTKAYVDIPKIVRDTVREIGYTRGKYGFDADTCGVITTIDEQSSDIAMGVDKALEAKENKMSEDDIEAIGAGDQGMMFGYASDETEEYMPYPAAMAHKLARRLTEVRKNGTLPYLRPDGKTQVTVEYDENGVPKRLDAVVLSTQHDPEVTQERIHEDIKKYVFDEVIPANMTDDETKFFINPTGRFVIGGPHGDSGLTGRKIIVDTYGGYARHGGGAFSGQNRVRRHHQPGIVQQHESRHRRSGSRRADSDIQPAVLLSFGRVFVFCGLSIVSKRFHIINRGMFRFTQPFSGGVNNIVVKVVDNFLPGFSFHNVPSFSRCFTFCILRQKHRIKGYISA